MKEIQTHNTITKIANILNICNFDSGIMLKVTNRKINNPEKPSIKERIVPSIIGFDSILFLEDNGSQSISLIEL